MIDYEDPNFLIDVERELHEIQFAMLLSGHQLWEAYLNADLTV